MDTNGAPNFRRLVQSVLEILASSARRCGVFLREKVYLLISVRLSTVFLSASLCFERSFEHTYTHLSSLMFIPSFIHSSKALA